MTHTHTCKNELCEHEFDIEYEPARPAPICSNPSDPRFSDSGNGVEIDGPEECPQCGHEVNIDKLLNELPTAQLE